MLELRHFAAIGMLAVGAAAASCGGPDDTTTCILTGNCGTDDASTHPDTGQQDTQNPDTRQCTPGDTKKIDCNTCLCNVDGLWVCTGNACPDTGPPNSPCPTTSTPGEPCTGTTHCIYHDPCTFGCDCFDSKWICGPCGA